MVLFLYIIMCSIFGTTFLFIKLGLESGWSPFLFSSLRFVMAGAIVLLSMVAIRRKILYPLKAHIQVAFVSFLMTTLPFAALYWGEQHISSGEAAVLVATSPLFILVINHFSQIERLTAIKVTGSAISMAGITIMVFSDINIVHNLESFLAKCFLLVAEVAFAVGSIKSKKLVNEISQPFILNGLQMFYGGLFLLVVSLLVQEDYSLPISNDGWGILLYFILVASILSYGIYYWLIKHTSVFFSSTWTYVSPVIALFLGKVVMEEAISLYDLIGAALILGGVLLANFHVFLLKKVTGASHSS